MSYPNLLSKIHLGHTELANRIWMAPLTRARAVQDHVPNALMAEYYGQRASAGLIIAEATAVMEGCSAFWTEPGIFSQAQVEGWKLVTNNVHKNGGKIFLQIWHGGRACHPLMNHGKQPIAPSAIPITNSQIRTPTEKVNHVTPKEILDSEIPTIIEGFRKGAENAKAAGFDGVEVHGANGYLLDEFLRDGSNKRTGPYGGTVAHRARLLFEVLEAVRTVWTEEGQVGLRLSPLNSYNSMIDSDPIATYSWIAQKLNDHHLAYLHVMRADFMGVQKADVLPPIREAYKGILVGNTGYTAEEAEACIASKQLDAVAFGVPFLANPDLPNRFAKKAELNPPRPEFFYVGGAQGYTDYPAWA